MSVFSLLLVVHICCGTLALICAGGAMYAAKGRTWHRHFGDFFFYGMTGIFATAIPMAILKSSLFLFLISFFSYYLAYTGRRYAENTKGMPTRADWSISVGMLLIALLMIMTGLYFYTENMTRAITLWVFSAIGISLSVGNLKLYRQGGAHGNERIVQHFTAMIGATIAAITAFVVTNVHLQPAIMLWLGPTIALVPVIFYWRRKYAYP